MLSDLGQRLVTAALQTAPDEEILRPLWDFAPAARKPVLHERRRRFGIPDERIDVAALSDDEDTDLMEAFPA